MLTSFKKPEKAVFQGTRQNKKIRKIDKKQTKLKIGRTDRNSKDNLKKKITFYKTNTNDVLPLRYDYDICIDTDRINSQILTLSSGGWEKTGFGNYVFSAFV